MSNFYLKYFKNSNAFKTISNMFRQYKKSCEDFFAKGRIKRNQSEPVVAQQKTFSVADQTVGKPKSEVDLPRTSNRRLEDWKGSAKFDDASSQESVRVTWSNSRFGKTNSNISLTKKSSCLDINVQEKLEHLPAMEFQFDEDVYKPKLALKRIYPWQNFNLTNARASQYEKSRSVGNLTHEMFKKSILKRQESKANGLKEVKFNKTASMLVYPKNSFGVMRQSRINLSTNIDLLDGLVGRKRKMKDASCSTDEEMESVTGNPPSCRKQLKSKTKKCAPIEDNCWYFNKKQKIC